MQESVRVAVAWYLPQYLATHGIALRDVLRSANVREDAFDHPDNTIDYHEFERVLVESGRRAGADDVGFEIGRRTHLRDFGIAGEVALCAPKVGAALRRFVELFNLHSTATIIGLVNDGESVRLVWGISSVGHENTRHLQLGAAVIAYNVLHELCGPNWRPLAVDIACGMPKCHRSVERHLNCRPQFDAGETSVHFERRWLEAPVPSADAARLRVIEAQVQSRMNELQRDFPALVRRLVRKQMLGGVFSMDDVAGLLDMHRRTLDRRLREHGLHYGDLVEASKHEVASQLLRETGLSIQRIAEVLQYSSAANFSTAFRRHAGVTPSAYRRLFA